jgi:hypothetical protein
MIKLGLSIDDDNMEVEKEDMPNLVNQEDAPSQETSNRMEDVD